MTEASPAEGTPSNPDQAGAERGDRRPRRRGRRGRRGGRDRDNNTNAGFGTVPANPAEGSENFADAGTPEGGHDTPQGPRAGEQSVDETRGRTAQLFDAPDVQREPAPDSSASSAPDAGAASDDKPYVVWSSAPTSYSTTERRDD